MERVERMKSMSANLNKNGKNLPTLRSSTLASKTIISLSKVDIDCKPLTQNRPLRTSSILEVQQSRSQSSIALRKQKESFIDQKLLTKNNFESYGVNSFKYAKDIKQEEQPSVQVSIEKAKISSKSYGIVRAYSANSHPGPVLSFNEDRICIITNLTKTNQKQKQVSFFGVYDGHQGVAKADYLRDNFHLCLVEDQAFPKDIDYAMRRTLKKLGSAFADDPKYAGDQSFVGFVLLIIYNEEIHYLQSGSCKSVFSSNLGERIFFPSNSETQLLTKEAVKKSRSVGELAKKSRGWREGTEIEYHCFRAQDNLDFVMLGSEGLFQNIKIRQLGRRCWLYLLRNKSQSIHFAVGEANNNLLNDVFSSLGSKNTSLIIVGFNSLLGCFQGPEAKEEIVLPYFPAWKASE